MGSNNDACCDVSDRRLLFFVKSNNSEAPISLAIAFSVPVLAAVVAFIVYASTGHAMNPAIVFTALSLFNLLRQPMMFLPRSLSAITDGRNALGRLQKVFMADTLAEDANPGLKESPYAICIDSADFEWEAVLEDQISVGKTTRDAGRRVANRNQGVESEKVSPNSPVPEEHAQPFGLHDISLAIPRGGNVYAIVGPVGSGKSSLIQGGVSLREVGFSYLSHYRDCWRDAAYAGNRLSWWFCGLCCSSSLDSECYSRASLLCLRD